MVNLHRRFYARHAGGLVPMFDYVKDWPNRHEATRSVVVVWLRRSVEIVYTSPRWRRA